MKDAKHKAQVRVYKEFLKEVLELDAKGLSTSQIAFRVGLSYYEVQALLRKPAVKKSKVSKEVAELLLKNGWEEDELEII